MLDFAYLFTVDLITLEHSDHADYEKRELGYGSCWLQAYIAAFREKSNGKITHDLLEKIQKIAMEFKNDKSFIGYKNNPNGCFGLTTKIRYVPENKKYATNLNWNISRDGLDEFLTHWFVNNPDPTHL